MASNEQPAIPVHILEHCNTLIGGVVEKLEQKIDKHTTEEMQRYKDILDAQKAMQQQIASLNAAVVSFMDKTDEFHSDIRKAFVKNEDGLPDYEGHRLDHRGRMTEAQKKQERMEKVLTGVMVFVCAGVGAWVLNVLWPAVLMGPPK